MLFKAIHRTETLGGSLGPCSSRTDFLREKPSALMRPTLERSTPM